MLVFGGCASTPSPKASASDNPPISTPARNPNGPNWEEIDRGVARIKEREKKKQEEQKASERVYTEDGKTVYEATILKGTWPKEESSEKESTTDTPGKEQPNQSPEPTPTAVTPPAGQEARQP